MSDEHFTIQEDPENARRFELMAGSGLRAKRAIRMTFYRMGKIYWLAERDLLSKQPYGGMQRTGVAFMLTRTAANGKRYTRNFVRSAPGQAPAYITGTLRKSVDFKVNGAQSLTFGETAPYAGFLEDGTRKMAPRPHLKAVIDRDKGMPERVGRVAFEQEFGE